MDDQVSEMIPMTNLFEVSARHAEDGYLVECAGELDISTVDRLEDAIASCLSDAAARSLHIDLSGVSFFGGDGVQLLLRTAQRCRERRIYLDILASPSAWRILELVGMEELVGVGAKVRTSPHRQVRADRVVGESRRNSLGRHSGLAISTV